MRFFSNSPNPDGYFWRRWTDEDMHRAWAGDTTLEYDETVNFNQQKWDDLKESLTDLKDRAESRRLLETLSRVWGETIIEAGVTREPGRRTGRSRRQRPQHVRESHPEGDRPDQDRRQIRAPDRT